jgi:hypothetical protein
VQQAAVWRRGGGFLVQQLAQHDHRLSFIEAALAALGHEAARAREAAVGALRAAVRDMQQKLRLTVPLLSRVVEYTEGLCEEWMIVRDKVLFYMGFYGMLRSSELAGTIADLMLGLMQLLM